MNFSHIAKILPILAISILPLKGLTMVAHAQDTSPNPQVQSMLDQRMPEILANASQIGNGGVVMRNGKIIGQSHTGVRQKGADMPIGQNDKWHIGSITKSITATMIGRLVDQNILAFEDTLADLWPDKGDQFDPAWREVTLSQLLHHTSGAQANFDLAVLLNRDFSDLAALDQAREKAVLDILAKAPKHEPGSTFEYSNVGYTIAGVLVAKTAGKSWENLVRQEVFDPLQLGSAGFGAPKGNNPWGHVTKWMVMTSAVDPIGTDSDNSAIMGPAGTVHMSLQDLAKYGQTHLATEAGDSDYLSAETAKWLHTPAKQTNEDHPPYAAGWIWMSFSDDERLSLFHNGSNTLWYAFLVNDPKTNASFAFATNIGNIKRSEFGFGTLTRDLLGQLDQQ